MLRILTYHRVLDSAAGACVNPSLVSAVPKIFDRQMRHLAKNYRVLSLEEVLDAQRGIHPLPAGAVLLTFDDAYRDFGEIVWPVLRRYALPALLFVPTAYPNHPERAFWWDRLYHALTYTPRTRWQCSHLGTLELATVAARQDSVRRAQDALKRLPHPEAMSIVDTLCAELGEPEPAARVLDWDELRELAADGITLGAHTRTHPMLTRTSIGFAEAEIRGSRDDLASRTGVVPRVFCYPFGAENEAVVELVAAAGFELAVSCIRGQNVLPTVNPFRLRRTNITPTTTPWLFRLRLAPAVSVLDGWRHRRRLARRNRTSTPSFSDSRRSE